MKMCAQIEALLNKFMEQAILCFPLPPCARLPLLLAKRILFSTKAYNCPHRGNRGKSPPPHPPPQIHASRVCTSLHIRLNMRIEQPTRGERTNCELGRKFLCLSLPALVIFCRSSLLSNFKAVLIVAGLKIRFHCGAHF